VPWRIASVRPCTIFSCACMFVFVFFIVFLTILIMFFLSFARAGLSQADTWSFVSCSLHDGHFFECGGSCWCSLVLVGSIWLANLVILVWSLSSSFVSDLLCASHQTVAYVAGFHCSQYVTCSLYLICPYSCRSVSVSLLVTGETWW
jgi:hypothetical protein